jgi:hypothetical protein
MTRNYSAAIWNGYGNERSRWAVHCAATGVYYFPKRYGKREAERLAHRMNERSN